MATPSSPSSPNPKGVDMVGGLILVSQRYFFYSGCDCKCYILLHMLGLVNRDSFSNNTLIFTWCNFFKCRKHKIPKAMGFEI
jgi:hypothetical protein